MKPVKLSIVICSLHSRRHLLREVVEHLQVQQRSDEIEILIAADAGQTPTGAKRNQLVRAATGEFIAHVDDDDDVHPEYVPKILAAIDANPNVDAVLIRGRRTHDGGNEIVFDYRLGAGTYVGDNDPQGVLWRSPGPLCPIRGQLAKMLPFDGVWGEEDLSWVDKLKPHLKTAVRAGALGEVLYHYQYDPSKKLPWMGISNEEKAVKIAGVMHANDHEGVFTPQYLTKSGPGSTLEFSAPYRKFLATFIKEHKIHSIVDLGCGDMEIMRAVDIGNAAYLGVDVIAERIARNKVKCPYFAFEQHDIHTWTPPPTELVLCKDVIQHWSTENIQAWLDLMKKAQFRYALITNCNYGPTVNTNIATGGWRAIDLTKPPFSMGKVVFQWNDKDVVMFDREGCFKW
jgi:hypothetical protein